MTATNEILGGIKYSTIARCFLSIFFVCEAVLAYSNEEVALFSSLPKHKNLDIPTIPLQPKSYEYDGPDRACFSDSLSDGVSDQERSNMEHCCSILAECSLVIPPGGEKYGITNNTPVNINNCMCDMDFRTCLERKIQLKDNPAYTELGRTYFNRQKPRCLLKIYPYSPCDSYYRENGAQSEYDDGYTFCPKLVQQKPF